MRTRKDLGIQVRLARAVAAAAALAFLAPAGAGAKPPHAEGDALPPGLAKQGKLPPGWEKKLHPGAVLERDIYAHAHRIPPEDTVYDEPEGVITIRVGGKVARVIEETREVVEVVAE